MKLILKKFFLVTYFFLKRIIHLLTFFVVYVFFKMNIYVSLFKNFYLLLIFELNFKNKQDLGKKISNFFILKKAKDIFSLWFLNAYFYNNGMVDESKNINDIFFSYQKLVKKIFKLEDKIIIGPFFFNKLGHFAIISFFIKAIKLNLIKEKKILIIGPVEKHNEFLLKKFIKFKEVNYVDLNDLDQNVKNNLNILNTYFDYFEINNQKVDFYQFIFLVSKKWNKNNRNSFISLSKNEINSAQQFFLEKQIDLKKNWFVLLHVRSTLREKINSNRNADISKFKKAIKYIISKNGFVIRIGDKKMKKIKEFKNFIDLTQDNDQHMKLIFLYFYAKFFMVTASGPSALTLLFNGPSIHLDYGPIYDTAIKEGDFLLPKMYYQNNILLTYKDRINSCYGKNVSLSFLKKSKIKSKNSTEQEIFEATKEFYNKIILKRKSKDTILRKAIKKICKKNYLISPNISNIIEKKYRNFFYEK